MNYPMVLMIKGSQFDGEGNLKNWWTESDLAKFKEKGKKYVEQFNEYEPLPGVFVQGEFTLGENIGDLGGLAVSLCMDCNDYLKITNDLI